MFSFKPFYSHMRLTCNFSIKYPQIIQQTGNENTQTYWVEDAILVKHQILLVKHQIYKEICS